MLRRLVLWSGLVLLAHLPAFAQPVQPTPDPADPAAAQAMLHGSLQLSIADAVAMGLKNNLDVEVSRHDPLSSWEDMRAAWGAYDPLAFADFGYESRKTPVASSLQSSAVLTERELGGQSGLQGKLPWVNAVYGVSYVGSSLESNSSIKDLSPEYTSRIVFQTSIPLLKNLIWDQDWTRVKQTRILYGVANDEFRRQVMDTVSNIETAYWDLVAQEEQERVAQKSVEAARALLRQTKTQYEVGVVSRVEVTEAEAGLATREVELIRAQNFHESAQDLLMNQVLGRGLRPGSRLAIVPTDRPGDYVVYEIDVEEAARKAFENRPELAALQQAIEGRVIEAKYRNNQKLPQLDVRADYSLAGISGKTNASRLDFNAGTRATNTAVNGLIGFTGAPVPLLPVPPPQGAPLVGRSYGSSHDTWSDADSWSARGVVSIPIGNVAARHLASRAEIELRKSHSELARLEQGIILGVRLAARNLESAQEGIEAAERARVAAEEQLRAERIRLEQGESTPFDVLLREESLVGAESSKINAIRIYRNSVVALDREQGTILKTRNILIDDVRTLR